MLYQVRKVKCLHSSALLLFVRLILDGILGVGMGCGGVHVFTCRFSVVDRRLYTSFTNLLILWPQYNTWALFCWDSSSFGSTSFLFKVLALHPNSNAFTPLLLGSYKRLDLQSPMQYLFARKMLTFQKNCPSLHSQCYILIYYKNRSLTWAIPEDLCRSSC